MKILQINNLNQSAKIEIVTQMNVRHVIEVEKPVGENFFYVLNQSSPLHPHISGSRICLDSKIRSGISSLLDNNNFSEALMLLGVSLEIINMSSAYGGRYEHLSQCFVCSEWKLRQTITRCRICGGQFCQSCSSKCDCGSGTSDTCLTCTKSSSSKCKYCLIETLLPSGEATIYRLDIESSILRILEKEIQTISQLDNLLESNVKLPGIGKVKIEQIKSAREQYQININGTSNN
jgi:hypothetical protein